MRVAPPAKLNLSSLVAAGVVVTVAVVVISGFALKTLAGQLGTNNQLLSKKRAAQKQITQNLENLDKLSTEYSSLGATKTLITDALPTTANFPAIVSMMEELSKNAGVQLLSVAPSETSDEGSSSGPTQYQFTASISAGYESFKAFLKNVEISLRPLAITTMKISGDSELLGIDMTIATYFQKDYDLELKKEPLVKAKSTSTSSSTNVDTSNFDPSRGASQ